MLVLALVNPLGLWPEKTLANGTSKKNQFGDISNNRTIRVNGSRNAGEKYEDTVKSNSEVEGMNERAPILLAHTESEGTGKMSVG